MTGTQVISGTENAADSVAGLRLSLKPAGSTSGYVDGAWWPRTTDLAAELPDLLARLTPRMGLVERVSYDMAAWSPADRRLTTGGVRVRMDGFRGRRPADAVHISGANRDVLTLLVIPPATAPEDAEEALPRAGRAGNEDTIDSLLHRDAVGASSMAN